MIAFDIETVKNEKADEYFAEHKSYSAPANYTDPVKIEKYIEKAREKDANKAGLTWFTGKVCCVCMEDVESGKKWGIYSTNEKEVLEATTEILDKHINKDLIGKSSADFDVPFLIGRYLVNEVRAPLILNPSKAQDVDNYFSRSRSCGQRSKLDTYAFALDLPMKPFDGSKVQGMYDEGKLEEIKDYCEHDVHIVAEMVRRWTKVFG
jgi:predicted PolB exonuclease-like 3'-5' exonuclease